MKEFILRGLEYAEAWALFIPLGVLLFRRHQPDYLYPVVWYVFLAFALNLMIDGIMYYNYRNPGAGGPSNNPLYNTHSIVRFFFLSVFFINLQPHFLKTAKLVLFFIFPLFVLVNFWQSEDFFARQVFSSRLLATEAGMLLFYCMQYYACLLLDDKEYGRRPPHFWIVVGLSIYLVSNFFIFLFYKTLTESNRPFAITIWDVHNFTFIILCIFIAKGFYDAGKH